ncbi:MAG: hypothetical protein V1896_02630 [Candidatus Zambryskibacteria bacterium]
MNNVAMTFKTKDDKLVSFEKTGLPGEVKTKILYYMNTGEPVEVEAKYRESGVIDMISRRGFNFTRPGYYMMLFSNKGEYQREYFVFSPNERLIDKAKWGKI